MPAYSKERATGRLVMSNDACPPFAPLSCDTSRNHTSCRDDGVGEPDTPVRAPVCRAQRTAHPWRTLPAPTRPAV